MKKLSVRSQLIAMLVGVVVLMVSFALVVWISVGSISSAADGMGQGKDVVADILPPPLYILEAELTVMQLQEEKSVDVTHLIEKLLELKNSYDERNSFWEKESLDDSVKNALLGEQKRAADRFWQLVLGDFIDSVKRGDSIRVRQLAGDISEAYVAHRGGVDATVKIASNYADNALKGLQSTSRRVRWLVLLMAVGGALLAAIVMTIVAREILHRLGGEPLLMQEAAHRIAGGDLTVQLEIPLNDTTSLLSAIGQMQANLRHAIKQSIVSADQVAEAAHSLAASATQVLGSSYLQSEASTSMAAAIEQVTVSISHVAESAASARNVAEETGSLSNEGKSLVQNTITEINKIADSVTNSSEVIHSLGEESVRISGIVNVIKDIADQTNLLALNAAIEAARAGDQGRGFAVVADEVRKLAERTRLSTKEITTMIGSVQSGSESAMLSMRKGREEVVAGVQMAVKSGESMVRVQVATHQVISEVEDIAAALQEQDSASTQIAKNVEKIAQMAEENCLEVNNVSQSANRLERLADDLKSSVGMFKI